MGVAAGGGVESSSTRMVEVVSERRDQSSDVGRRIEADGRQPVVAPLAERGHVVRPAGFGAALLGVGLDWQDYVEIDAKYFRPAEVELLIGDYSKAKKKLGWEPKTRFEDLTKLMVDEDVRRLKEHREGKSKLVG